MISGPDGILHPNNSSDEEMKDEYEFDLLHHSQQ